jgi:hypothetical protein
MTRKKPTLTEIEHYDYRFISDPGHGWLEVPFSFLEVLGIHDQITTYSYRNGPLTYLEEDCDLSTFMRQFREQFGKSINYTDEYQENTFVRNLNYYQY